MNVVKKPIKEKFTLLDWLKNLSNRAIIYKKSTYLSKHAKRKRIRKKHADRIRRLGL